MEMSILKSTSTYGEGFKRVEVENEYSIRIYTGGFAGVKTAEERAKREADRFLEESMFSAYEILDSRRIWLPFSCVEFTLKFRS
jgi:hypothetical protein